MGDGYVAVDDRVEVILVVDKTTVDELFDRTTDDFDVIVELFAEVDDIFVMDGTRLGIPFAAGTPVTRRGRKSIQKPRAEIKVNRFMAAVRIYYGESGRCFSVFMNVPWLILKKNRAVLSWPRN